MALEKVTITAEKETLLITLMSRARETQKPDPIITDPYALEMLDAIDYDFSGLEVPAQTAVAVCMRAVQFDRYTRNFLKHNSKALVLHIGCGLDSRYFRLGQPRVQWYDLDFPEVINLKHNFFKETRYFHMKGFDITDKAWRKELFSSKQPTLILAEGLFMYIPETKLRMFFTDMIKAGVTGQIIFDAYSCLTAKKVKNHPSIKKTGAVIHWGIDDPRELENWEPGLKFMEEWYFSQSPDVEKLKGMFKLLFKFAGKFKIANMAHRVIRYAINP